MSGVGEEEAAAAAEEVVVTWSARQQSLYLRRRRELERTWPQLSGILNVSDYCAVQLAATKAVFREKQCGAQCTEVQLNADIEDRSVARQVGVWLAQCTAVTKLSCISSFSSLLPLVEGFAEGSAGGVEGGRECPLTEISLQFCDVGSVGDLQRSLELCTQLRSFSMYSSMGDMPDNVAMLEAIRRWVETRSGATLVVVYTALNPSPLADVLQNMSTLQLEHCFTHCPATAKRLAQGLQRGGPPMQLLSLTGNDVGDAGCSHLAKAIASGRSVRDLRLRQNEIGAEGAAALALAIMKGKLWSLDVSNNKIGDMGAGSLAVALERDTTLTEINLTNNNISAAGGLTIVEALRTNGGLTMIALNENRLEDCAEHILHVMGGNCRIKYFVVDFRSQTEAAQLQHLLRRNDKLDLQVRDVALRIRAIWRHRKALLKHPCTLFGRYMFSAISRAVVETAGDSEWIKLLHTL